MSLFPDVIEGALRRLRRRAVLTHLEMSPEAWSLVSRNIVASPHPMNGLAYLPPVGTPVEIVDDAPPCGWRPVWDRPWVVQRPPQEDS
jgi:hypothetical protein